MWLSIIGVVALLLASVLLVRVRRKVEEFERETTRSADHERRLKNLETFKKQMEYSGEHAIVDVPPNVHPRVVDYSEESV